MSGPWQTDAAGEKLHHKINLFKVEWLRIAERRFPFLHPRIFSGGAGSQPNQICSMQEFNCRGWTLGILMTLAFVAAESFHNVFELNLIQIRWGKILTDYFLLIQAHREFPNYQRYIWFTAALCVWKWRCKCCLIRSLTIFVCLYVGSRIFQPCLWKGGWSEKPLC